MSDILRMMGYTEEIKNCESCNHSKYTDGKFDTIKCNFFSSLIQDNSIYSVNFGGVCNNWAGRQS